jgi:hypothetical protein
MSQHVVESDFSSLRAQSSRWAAYMHLLSLFGDAAAAIAVVRPPRIRGHSAEPHVARDLSRVR